MNPARYTYRCWLTGLVIWLSRAIGDHPAGAAPVVAWRVGDEKILYERDGRFPGLSRLVTASLKAFGFG